MARSTVIWRKVGIAFALVLGLALVLAATQFYGTLHVRSLNGAASDRVVAYLILRDQLEQLVGAGRKDLSLCVSAQTPVADGDVEFVELQVLVRAAERIRLLSPSECLGNDATGYRSPGGDEAQVLFARYIAGHWLGGLGCGGTCAVAINGYRVYSFLGYAVVLRGDPWIV